MYKHMMFLLHDWAYFRPLQKGATVWIHTVTCLTARNMDCFKVTFTLFFHIHTTVQYFSSYKTRSINTLRTGDADLRFYVTTVQDGWSRFAFLTRWNSVQLQVLLSATPQGGMFPEVSHPQALLGSLVSISRKFQFTKIVSEFEINF